MKTTYHKLSTFSKYRTLKIIRRKPYKKSISCSDKIFISPIVETVQRDITVILALEPKILNKSIQKNKYQIVNLIDTMQQNFSTGASNEKAYFIKKGFEVRLQPIKFRPGNFPPLKL